MPKYVLNFFVDYGADQILWWHTPAPDGFVGLAELDELPITKELVERLCEFGKIIDTQFDGYIESLKEYPKLEATKNALLVELRKQLGDDYEIVDKMA